MKTDLDQLFADFSKMKVAVIGDIMLDTYWWGNVERISPEAPVPIVALNKREKRIGGAGNVALNLVSLGAQVAVLTLLGSDEDGETIKNLLRENNIDNRYVLESNKRITTNKIRIISRNQHMMRLDAEQTSDLEEADSEKMRSLITRYIQSEKPSVVILEDYNKGLLTPEVISLTLDICHQQNIPVAVDPKRKNFFEFKKATLFKPNLGEAMTALNLLPEEITIERLQEIHEALKKELDHKISLITLSEKGIFYQDGKQKEMIPSHRRNIADVSGAGDTVIAVASLVYGAGGNISAAAQISNIAGGIVCEEVGTVPINKEKLFAECKRLQQLNPEIFKAP